MHYTLKRILPLLLICYLTVPSLAQEMNLAVNAKLQDSPSSKLVADGIYQQEYSINKFMLRNEQLYLRNTSSEYELTIPISERMNITEATLHLEYTNSIALLQNRSMLRVSFDDVVIFTTALSPTQAISSTDISIPLKLLKPGYRKLKFWVAQHYSIECEDPAAPELWTQINSVESKLKFNYNLKSLQPTLAQLPTLIDSKLWGDFSVNIIFDENLSDQHLLWGSLAAQGAALRLKYKPLGVNLVLAKKVAIDNALSLNQADLKGRDSILIGTVEEIKNHVTPEIASSIKEGYLGIFPMNNDPSHFLIVISGNTESQVTDAATAFSFLNFPIPDTQSLNITKTDIPKLPDYGSEISIRENGQYRFSYFGARTKTMRGMYGGEVRLDFRLPPDLFASESTMVDLDLHFSYGAGMRADSVLNIFLNERFENVIHLKNESGGVFRNYRIQIPLRSFKPGRNTISFTPRLTPLISGRCSYVQEENLQFTLFEDSVMTIPNASHYAELPNLQLFATSGFPISIKSDGSEFTVFVAEQNPKTVASAWMMMSKLAQVVASPLFNTTLSFQQPDKERNVIVVGSTTSLNREFIASAPRISGEDGKIPFTSTISETPDEGEVSFIGNLLLYFKRGARTEIPFPVNKVANIHASDRMGEYGSLMQYVSPYSSSKSFFLLTADTPDRLYDTTRLLVKPEMWGQLQGDLAVWNNDSEIVSTQKVANRYYTGSLSITGLSQYFFSKNPYLWIVILLAVFVVLAFSSRHLLKRYKLRNHPHA